MKAILSSTYDNNYFFFIPIVTWCWNKLGVDVIVFLPPVRSVLDANKIVWLSRIQRKADLKIVTRHFMCSPEKDATYAQCVRLYASSLKEIPVDEVLVTSDVDMAVFNTWNFSGQYNEFYVVGHDLVPPQQYPMCYLYAPAGLWRRTFVPSYDYQWRLDNLLGSIVTDNMRGNYWAKDQEEAYKAISPLIHKTLIPRARPNTQFADNRVDRDDAFWRERLNPALIDAHLWRPGFTDQNFMNILELLHYKYTDSLQWLIDAKQEYLELTS